MNERKDDIEVDESILQAKTHEILSSSNLNEMSFKILFNRLEQEFNQNLSSAKDRIRVYFNQFVDSLSPIKRNPDDSTTSLSDGTGKRSIKEEDTDDGNTPTTTPKKGKSSGFTAPVQLSSELSQFLNCEFLPRTEVTKQIWAYIKANNLQNPNDKREILCDEKLENLFKRKSINMFKMTKVLSQMMKAFDELQDLKVTVTDAKLYIKQEKKLADKAVKKLKL